MTLPPAGRRRLLVVAALARRRGRVLLARRRDDQPMGGCWEFPGGKVEPGESPERALARELREELGVRGRVGRIRAVVSHAYPEFDLLMLVYGCTLAGRPRPRAVAEVAWVTPAEMLRLPLLPADRPLARTLAARARRVRRAHG
jgi:8-oxo-dGTP diphosphatase